jgi:hypothetical protein
MCEQEVWGGRRGGGDVRLTLIWNGSRRSKIEGTEWNLNSVLQLLNFQALLPEHQFCKQLPTNDNIWKIWDFHGGDYEEWCLLECYVVWQEPHGVTSQKTPLFDNIWVW